MYFWKCWRDTRRAFSIYLILAVGGTLLWFMGMSHELLRGSVRAAPEEALWFLVVSGGLAFGLPFAAVMGLGLGSRSVGTEVGGEGGDFLMTRPRSRKYFVWVGWTVGLAEIAILLAVTALVALAALYYEGGAIWRHMPVATHFGPVTQSPTGGQAVNISLLLTVVDIPLLLASVAVIAIVVHGLTYFLSVLTRSGRRAVTYSLVLILAFWTCANLLDRWGHFSLPNIATISLYRTHLQGPPIWYLAPELQLIGWLVLAVAFPVAAQRVLERSDI
ncbi:MAG TPA: hypothetical protein VJX72_15565 [Candidatus Acidoferrum sp.]|nr:hypothetical protein [Candidatus Acidoferrum sp.]